MSPARAAVRVVLFLILLVLARPALTAEPVRTPHYPALSPDGARIAFSWHGDLWIVSSQGGEAKRLAALPGYDTRPKWSPDGRTLAFDSNRHGNYDVYTIPAAGGTPTRETFHDADDLLGDWSPDGSELYFASQRDTRAPSLYRIRLSDGRV